MLWSAVDLVYPPVCAGCEKPGVRWCKECEEKVHSLENDICTCCGDLVEQGHTLCHRCQQEHPPVEMLRSWGVYRDPLQKAIQRFKFQHDLSLGETFSVYMQQVLDRNNWKIDVIVPVPIHEKHRRERGYNQAAMLAIPLALATGIQYNGRTIRWAKEIESQVGLSVTQRKANVKDAFLADSSIIFNKNVLIVDDIATTGSTIFESASACTKAGANKVYGLTLARAVT